MLPWVRNLVDLLTYAEPDDVLEEEDDPKGEQKVVYRLYNFNIRHPRLTDGSFPYEEIPLVGRSRFLSTKEASIEYDLPQNTISKLCNKGFLVCRRSRIYKNRWEVEEESLREYCAQLHKQKGTYGNAIYIRRQ